MHPIWKPLAILSLSLAALLAGMTLWLSLRENPMAARMRRNVEEQVRFHLEQKEPEKAAAVLEASKADLHDPFLENRLRIEVARASEPEQAAKILDGLIPPAMDREQAADVAQTRLDLQRRLFDENVLQDGALPAPFEPASFRREEAPAASVEDMRRITAKLLVLVSQRRDLAKRHGAPVDPALARAESLATAARYALGESPYESVKLEDPEIRFRFGDLLFRERQFERAIETWTPLLDDKRVIRRIAELAALRRFAPKDFRIWDFDVDKLLGRDRTLESQVMESVQSIFKQSRPGVIRQRKGIPRDDAVVTPPDEPAIFFPNEDPIPPKAEIAVDPNQLYLLVEHRLFELQNKYDRPFLTRAAPQLRLSSAYAGPIRFRLFKVRDLQTLTALDADAIVPRRAELQPVRDWQHEFTPLGDERKNNSEWLVQIPSCAQGLYVLMADARYCPVFAFARFIVTDTGLLQQPALDRVLIHSVDRITGAPVANLPVEGELSGQFVLKPADLLPRDDSNAEEFRRGFDAGWAKKPSEPDAAPSYLRGFQHAVALRAGHPDLKTTFRGATGKDGIFEWTVTPAWREGYQYAIRTTSTQGGTCTRVESAYSLKGDEARLLALVYADRPLYRGGDTVSFKVLLRLRDGEGLRPYDGRDALVEIGTGDRTIYARSLPATDFGSVSGSLDLLEECARSQYWVRVNNGPGQALFKVEDYHKPEFEIALKHPKRVRAGESVDVAVQVRRYSGEPLAKTRVVISVESAVVSSAVHLIDEWGGVPVRSPHSPWRPLEERQLLTDEEGRCLLRFQTPEGVAARYGVTARATEESGREVRQSSMFESAAQTREVLFETDRTVYFPGETARLRFRLPGAATARIEERAKVEKPFSFTVPLAEGAGGCDYPVPAEDRDLQIGVREGEGWSWTKVSLRIMARGPEAGLVNVRLDHPLYRVGETATVEITSSEPDASVLLLVATGRIHRRQLVRLVDRKASFPLEVRDEDIPNVHVVAITVKNDSVGKATAVLNVPPLDRFLTVQVSTDLPEYRPGQECKAVLRVTDAKGRPVPECELSLGVVDESIYALQQDVTPDLREFFHRYSRPLNLQESFFYREPLPTFTIWKCPVFVRGQMGLYDAMGVGQGGGGGGRYGGRFGGKENLVARGGGSAATSRRQARSDFRDTAYWNAHVKTAADGTATASFNFPDNLTRFRFTARGITRDHQVGEVRQETVVRKPFFVTLATPRVLQEGNEVALSGVVHNQTDKPQTVRVSFKSPFPALGSTATPTIALLPGESSAVQVLLSIDRYAPEAEVVFGAESDAGENDALALRLPGRRHASPFLEGRSGSVAGGTPREEVFRIPEDAIPGTIVLKFDFDAGIHTAISGAIDPLIEYPYGCVEQTMTRFLPAVAARRALGDLPPRLREKLPSVIAAGLQRLYALQNRDGSWGWWAAGPQNSPLTAYVLFGLSICKKAGVGVDRSVADLAAKRILERLGKSVFEGVVPGQGRLPMTHSLDPRIHELLALAEYHSAWNVPSLQLRQLIETMADRRDTLGPTDEIVLGLAAARLGLNDVAAPLAERAAKRIPDDVASASFLLQLQAARGGDLAPTVRFLLARRRGKGWANTIESAHAILGLAAAVERPSPAMDLPPGRVEVRVNGAFAQEILLKGTADAAFDGRYTIPAPAGGWGGKTVVRLSYDGQGAAYYTASLEASLGGEDRPPVSRGLEIRREYYERDSDGVGWHPVEGAIALGHTVLVVLRVETSGSRDYLMVSDPRPDGFEPLDFHVTSLNGRWTAVRGLSDRVDLERGWQGRLEEFQRTARGDAARESAWGKALLREIIEQRRFSAVGWGESVEFPSAAGITHVEHRDDRTIFFLDSLNPGAQCVWYLARAELPGRTHALAPRVEAMYEPALNASGSEARLEVADGRLIRSKPRTFSNAAGVNGLLELLPHLGTVDADALIHHIPGNPRIGELLVSVCTEPAIRAWLTAASATSAAGRSLRERIEAAREDLATRQLCVEALGGAPREWLPALDAALADDALARKVLEGSDPETRTAADNLLFWTQEDRDWRMGLFAAAQKLRGSARLSLERMPRLGFSRILEALGPEAPVGEELLRWKLAQRWKVSALSLEEFARRCERDLALKLRLKILGTEHVGECQGPVGSILDQVLLSLQLCYRVQGDEIWIGPPEELFR